MSTGFVEAVVVPTLELWRARWGARKLFQRYDLSQRVVAAPTGAVEAPPATDAPLQRLERLQP
eukprot:5597739-Alexandrium_andersonii.AAC.1